MLENFLCPNEKPNAKMQLKLLSCINAKAEVIDKAAQAVNIKNYKKKDTAKANYFFKRSIHFWSTFFECLGIDILS